MLEKEVAEVIKKQGWKILKGPFYNSNLALKGVHVWTIKSVLSKKELDSRGIKHDKSCPPGSVRTVRFIGVIEDGEMKTVRHITSSERKKLSIRKRENGGKDQ
jgi:hypothetical protein